MFRLFLRVLTAFLALIGIVLLIGCLLPRNYAIETSVIIEAPSEKVFPLINELRKWESWSPISEERIQGLTANFSGADAGEGAIQTWSESRGDGKMWIVNSQPNHAIEYRWRFANFPELVGTFRFESEPNQSHSPLVQLNRNDDQDQSQSQNAPASGADFCKVTWSSSGRLPSGPFYGFFGLIFENAMNREYAASLQRLKHIVEASN